MEVDGDVGALRAFDAIVKLPRAGDLAAVARAVTTRAFEARRRDADTSQVTRLADEIALERAEGETPLEMLSTCWSMDRKMTRSARLHAR